jgi:hypothetical protein
LEINFVDDIRLVISVDKRASHRITMIYFGRPRLEIEFDLGKTEN